MSDIGDRDEKALLKAFLLDDTWEDSLRKWNDGVNIFDVLQISRTEIRHSNMLGWLLDPRESHGLGDAFLSRFVRRILAAANGTDGFRFLTADWSNAIVRREWAVEKKRLDILVECPVDEGRTAEKVAIAIENKIDAKDGDNQLGDYRRGAEERFGAGACLFVYLTPMGDEPERASEEEKRNWVCMPYADIAMILDSLNPADGLTCHPAKFLIEEYRKLIGRNIMTNEELKALCNEIYRKHKGALDLIFKNADVSGAIGEAKRITAETVKEICDMSGGRLLYAGDRKGSPSRAAFHSSAMNGILAPYNDKTKGSWRNGDVYYYWFEVKTDMVSLVVEFGPDNREHKDDESFVVMGKVIKSNCKLDGQFRRLKTLKIIDLRDGQPDSDAIRKKVSTAIEKLAEWETGWLNSYRKVKRSENRQD